MSVRPLGRADEKTWLEVARRCPYATYFHTPAWARLMTAVYPQLSIATRAFRLEDGSLAVLPLLQYKLGAFFRGYESMVPGVYGGPIAERMLRTDEVDELLDAVVDMRTTALRVFGNPFLPYFRTSAENASEFTHVIDLRPGFDTLFARFSANHRYSYRQAVRSGLRLEAANSLEEFREYFAIYQMSRQRWGDQAKSDHPFSLFERIHQNADPEIILRLAKLDGQVIAGYLWVHWNRHGCIWHGASDPAFFKKFPSNFLITEIIRDGCQRGDERFDFSPSAGIETLARFKDFFRAERVYFRHGDRRGSRVHQLNRLVRSKFHRQYGRLRSLLH